MRKHTLTLALAAVLATAPALAADWAHNDPDKASAGKVQIWDGSKTVTVNSAPTTAVATMGGGTALGQVVASKLSLAQFIAANDLESNNWRDITWTANKNSISIAGTELAKRIGTTSFTTVKNSSTEITRHLGTGTFNIPAGSAFSFRKGQQTVQHTECEERNGGRDRTSSCRTYPRCNREQVTSNNGRTIKVGTVAVTKYEPCSDSPSINNGPSELTITTPLTSSNGGLNYFLKVNE